MASPVKSINWNDEGAWEKQFPVVGQGVVIFNKEDANTPFIISIEDKPRKNRISLVIDSTTVAFYKVQDGLSAKLCDSKKAGCGYEKGMVAYWYSYDRDNLVVKYGKGYRMEQTTILTHDFLTNVKDEQKVRDELSVFFNPSDTRYIREYDVSTVKGGVNDLDPTVEFDKNPFICNLPPLVYNSGKTNLFILDDGNYVLSSSLPPAARELYENVSHCDLNYPAELDSVLLSDAIRYSINTKGCLLYNKLQEKAGEFNPDKPNIKATYLRITLGMSLGKSPGIPYVLEIWPSGHYSPIHNHGNANAVIKVLYGSIHVKIYNKHVSTHDATPLVEFDGCPGDCTWITRNWYQTHKLINITQDYCATIQCYNYDAGDTTHWPYFDYISQNETIEEFRPNTDFTFREMRSKVLDEYKRKTK